MPSSTSSSEVLPGTGVEVGSRPGLLDLARARVEQLFISPGHNCVGRYGLSAGRHPSVRVDAVECVEGRGIVGDRFFGFQEGYKGQVTFFDLAVFHLLQRELQLPDARPEATRRNIFVTGADLPSLIGVRFELQGIGFEGVEECRPCSWMDLALGPGAERWLRGRGGLRCRVLNDGWLRAAGTG